MKKGEEIYSTIKWIQIEKNPKLNMFGDTFFYIIGVYTFLWWFIDNFKSLFAIIWSVLMSYITPELYPPLNEKFGNWAGEWERQSMICEYERKKHIIALNCLRPWVGHRQSINVLRATSCDELSEIVNLFTLPNYYLIRNWDVIIWID